MKLKSSVKKISLLILFYTGIGFSQTPYENQILEFQAELNAEYKNPNKSPLTTKEIEKFKGHQFYPIDETYRVNARFIKIENPVTVDFQTSAGIVKQEETYAIASFELNGKTYELTLYQSPELRETEEYKDYLFLPFTDYTSGVETYGAGRYIDLTIPEGNTIIIDFNKAYNPFCAYSPNYACPIPPEENDLKIKIEAGILSPKEH